MMIQDIKKIGVVGSGQMGNGIVQVAAQFGFDVVMTDISAPALEIGKFFNAPRPSVAVRIKIWFVSIQLSL